MKWEKKRQEKKVYRTNVDTISLNVEQFGGGCAPFYPGPAFWEKPILPWGKGMPVGFEIYNICCWTR